MRRALMLLIVVREAIICVLEDKKKSQNALGRLLANGTTSPGPDRFASDTASLASNATANKPVLRLKGRIYIRHIKRVHDTSSANELSLTIDMEDERLESFILIFRSVELVNRRVNVRLLMGFR